MASLNRATLMGRLGADPEVRTFQNGNRVVNFRIATSETWRDREGNKQERTFWHSIAIFNEKLGEIAERFLRKGHLVLVEGQIETRKWTASDGTERWTTEIVLRQFGGQLVLMPNDRGDRGGDDDRRERGGTSHSERSWDSGGGKGGDGYKHPASSYRHGPGAGAMDDDIPFGAEFR